MFLSKGLLQSKTAWLITLLTLLAQYQAEIQAALMNFIPAPWNALVPPIMAAIIALLGIFGIVARAAAKQRVEGVWQRKPL